MDLSVFICCGEHANLELPEYTDRVICHQLLPWRESLGGEPRELAVPLLLLKAAINSRDEDVDAVVIRPQEAGGIAPVEGGNVSKRISRCRLDSWIRERCTI